MNTMAKSADQVALDRAFEKQVAAFSSNPYPSLEQRLDRIERMIQLLVNNQVSITESVVADFGRRPYQMTRLQEVLSPLNNFKHAKKHLKSWMRKERRKSSFPYNLVGGKSYVQHVPLGVIANISPWNFPFTLALSPLAGIVAAGNNCIIKPSEYTPNASALMKDLISKHFDESELAVVEGDSSIASAICQMPFNHIMFTGSGGIGAKILQASAQQLTSTTLELGGKSPVIISESIDLKKIAIKLLAAKLASAGQICMAPDYVLVTENNYDSLVNDLKNAAATLFPAGHDSGDFSHIISETHCNRLKHLVSQAESVGNTAIPLFGDKPKETDVRYMAPCLVEIQNLDCELMQQEIFGPVLPIVKVKDFAGAFEVIKRNKEPLITYCFTKEQAERDAIVHNLPCGNIVFNEFFLNYLQQDLPFGGVGSSGMGCYNAYDGFKNFSHAKAVFESPSMDVGKLLRPPFGDDIKKTLDKELGTKQ